MQWNELRRLKVVSGESLTVVDIIIFLENLKMISSIICLSVFLCLLLSACLFLSVRLSICVFLSLYLSVSLSACFSVCHSQPVFLSVSVSLCLPVCLSLFGFVSLSLCLSLSFTLSCEPVYCLWFVTDERCFIIKSSQDVFCLSIVLPEQSAIMSYRHTWPSFLSDAEL